MKKMRRIYYVPGMMSLIILPIICSIYLNKLNHEERMIEIILPSKYNPLINGRNSIVFDTTVLSRPENLRNYETLELDSDYNNNKEKLKLFSEKIDKLIKTRDTINGIHLLLGKGLKYGQFVEAINTGYFKDTINLFIIYENHLWYCYKNHSTSEKIDVMNYRKHEIEIINESKEKRIMERTIELGKEPISIRFSKALKVWPCFIVVLFLGFISIHSMIKR